MVLDLVSFALGMTSGIGFCGIVFFIAIVLLAAIIYKFSTKPDADTADS